MRITRHRVTQAYNYSEVRRSVERDAERAVERRKRAHAVGMARRLRGAASKRGHQVVREIDAANRVVAIVDLQGEKTLQAIQCRWDTNPSCS